MPEPLKNISRGRPRGSVVRVIKLNMDDLGSNVQHEIINGFVLGNPKGLIHDTL